MHRQAEIDLARQRMEELEAMTDKELLEYAWVELGALCGAKLKPAKRWTMTVPVDALRDSDVIFEEVLKRFEKKTKKKRMWEYTIVATRR